MDYASLPFFPLCGQFLHFFCLDTVFVPPSLPLSQVYSLCWCGRPGKWKVDTSCQAKSNPSSFFFFFKKKYNFACKRGQKRKEKRFRRLNTHCHTRCQLEMATKQQPCPACFSFITRYLFMLSSDVWRGWAKTEGEIRLSLKITVFSCSCQIIRLNSLRGDQE